MLVGLVDGFAVGNAEFTRAARLGLEATTDDGIALRIEARFKLSAPDPVDEVKLDRDEIPELFEVEFAEFAEMPENISSKVLATSVFMVCMSCSACAWVILPDAL